MVPELTPGDRKSYSTSSAPTGTGSGAAWGLRKMSAITISILEFLARKNGDTVGYSPLLSRGCRKGFLPIEMVVPGSGADGSGGRCGCGGREIEGGAGGLRAG